MVSERQCIVEMSTHRLKFYVVALELQGGKYFVVEIWKMQAFKVLAACE